MGWDWHKYGNDREVSIKFIESGQKRKRLRNKWTNPHRIMGEKKSNICIIRVPEGEGKKLKK